MDLTFGLNSVDTQCICISCEKLSDVWPQDKATAGRVLVEVNATY